MRQSIDTDFFGLPRPRAMAHRGASGVCPENTIAAFRRAVQLRAPYIELDVHMTRDGEIVVIHDSDLERVSGRPGLIRKLTYAQLADYDVGFTYTADGVSFPFRGAAMRVPRLAEVVEEFAETRFVVEIKQSAPSLVKPLLDVIDRAEMRRMVLIASEHQGPIDEVRKLAPDIPTNFSSAEVAAFMQGLASNATDYRAPGDALQIPPRYESYSLVTPQSVAAAHRLEVEVHVWTVNDVAEMRQLLGLGVDGIITDFPDRLVELL